MSGNDIEKNVDVAAILYDISGYYMLIGNGLEGHTEVDAILYDIS